jgi:hypothetical protein
MFSAQMSAVVVLSLAALRFVGSEKRGQQNIGFGLAALTLVLLGYIFVQTDFFSAVGAERY